MSAIGQRPVAMRSRCRTRSPAEKETPKATRLLVRREGALPAERLPLILEVAPNADYALIDSGDGEKLEQYGPYRIVRPEGQAIWRRALPPKEWERADADLHRRHRRGRPWPLAVSRKRRSAKPGR